MPSTNGNAASARQRIISPSLYEEQARRISDIHSDFVAIAYAMGSSRKDLQKSGPWYEACRNPKEYEPTRPYIREDQMIQDAVLTVGSKGTEAERKAVRAAVTQYYETRCRLSLEPLGEVNDSDTVKLTLESNEEVSEAQNAMITAINSKTPESFATASRELTEALTPMEMLRDLCARRARFFTPRTNKLFQAAR